MTVANVSIQTLIAAKIQAAVNEVEGDDVTLLDCEHMLAMVLAAVEASGYTICESNSHNGLVQFVPAKLQQTIQM